MSGGRSLRALAVSDFYLPRPGGIERVLSETARRFPAAGVEVEVLTRRLEPGSPGHEVLEGVDVWRLGAGPAPLVLEAARLRRAARAWAAPNLVRFDVAHAHLTLTALPLLRPLATAGVPLVATFYGPWHREYLAETADPGVPSRWPGVLRHAARPLVARLLKAGQRRVLLAARRLVVLSAHSLGELDEFGYTGRPPAEIVPGGVDVERFCPQDPDLARSRLGLPAAATPLVVSVRRLVPRMGLETLVDAVARLRGRFPGIALVIGGEGALAERLRDAACAAGVGERVRLLGRVAEADLPALYQAADLAVLPSRTLEGFGLPVLEAWACGVPVVATPVGALGETVARLDPGLLAEGHGAEALAAAMARALAAGRARFGGRARALALGYRWEEVVSRLAAIYRQVRSAEAGA